MTVTAFFLIVASSVLHASWNLIAKKNTMTMVLYWILGLCGATIWCHVQFWTPVHVFSLPLRFWLLLLASVTVDMVYGFGLVLTYRKMDMASAYPMMRAMPILLTALVTSILGIGSPIGPVAVFGFFLVLAGSLMMPLDSFSDFKLSRYANSKMLFILIAAFGTTGYTILDSQAQKAMRDFCANIDVSKTVISLTYYSTRAIVLSSIQPLVILWFKSERKILKDYIVQKNYRPMLAGLCSSGTYILVLIAMNYVTNVSYVQVFRQLGLPIGMAAGILILKEKSALVKWVGVSLILCGFVFSVL